MDTETIVNNAAEQTGKPAGDKKAHKWDRHPRDWYVEPEWCSERLFAMGLIPKGSAIWDPAAGMGRIPAAARAAGYAAFGSDAEPRSSDVEKWDFFVTPSAPTGFVIVSNPPFGKAQEFVAHALACSLQTIMLLPSSWIQGEQRAKWLRKTPLEYVLFICPRPSMPPGELVQQGAKPGNGSRDYAWFVWRAGYAGAPSIGWCVK